MDLAKVILREMRSHYLADKLRMSLYASPAHLEPGANEEEKNIAEESRSRILELHNLVPTGAVYAFARFSSALSLDVNHYSVDYAGMVTTDWFPQPLEIFRVNFMDGPKKAS